MKKFVSFSRPRIFLGLCVMLLLALSSWAQKQPTIGAIVASAQYDKETGITTAHVVNISKKEITAFDLSFVVELPDGSTTPPNSSFAGMDFIDPFLRGEHGILPGASYDYEFHGQKGPVEATVDVVVYADGTADVENNVPFQNFMNQRRGEALAMQKTNEVINKALANSKDPHPSATALAELQALLKSVDTTDVALPVRRGYSLELKNEIQDLSHCAKSFSIRNNEEEDRLGRLVHKNSDFAPMLIRHSELVKGGAL